MLNIGFVCEKYAGFYLRKRHFKHQIEVVAGERGANKAHHAFDARALLLHDGRGNIQLGDKLRCIVFKIQTMHFAAPEFYGAGVVIFIQIHFNTIEALFIADHAERGAVNSLHFIVRIKIGS